MLARINNPFSDSSQSLLCSLTFTRNHSIMSLFLPAGPATPQGFMGPQGEEVVEATSLAARLGSAIVDIEVRGESSM